MGKEEPGQEGDGKTGVRVFRLTLPVGMSQCPPPFRGSPLVCRGPGSTFLVVTGLGSVSVVPEEVLEACGDPDGKGVSLVSGEMPESRSVCLEGVGDIEYLQSYAGPDGDRSLFTAGSSRGGAWLYRVQPGGEFRRVCRVIEPGSFGQVDVDVAIEVKESGGYLLCSAAVNRDTCVLDVSVMELGPDWTTLGTVRTYHHEVVQDSPLGVFLSPGGRKLRVLCSTSMLTLSVAPGGLECVRVVDLPISGSEVVCFCRHDASPGAIVVGTSSRHVMVLAGPEARSAGCWARGSKYEPVFLCGAGPGSVFLAALSNEIVCGDIGRDATGGSKGDRGFHGDGTWLGMAWDTDRDTLVSLTERALYICRPATRLLLAQAEKGAEYYKRAGEE